MDQYRICGDLKHGSERKPLRRHEYMSGIQISWKDEKMKSINVVPGYVIGCVVPHLIGFRNYVWSWNKAAAVLMLPLLVILVIEKYRQDRTLDFS